MDERDAEIVQIAQSIEELAAIFKELAAMVIDQGTCVCACVSLFARSAWSHCPVPLIHIAFDRVGIIITSHDNIISCRYGP